MPGPIRMILTADGLDALVDAQNGETDAIRVAEVGLTAAAFDPAPTLEALPGEFKRLATVSGQSVSPSVIHMTSQDPSTDIYVVRGVALYLEDGRLFATYGQADPIFNKVSVAAFLLALDIAFNGDVGGDITFGDALFLNPPATETVMGVLRIATQALANAGLDDATAISPLKLKIVLDALRGLLEADINDLDAALTAAIAALAGRTITGAGLAMGGGNLTADRVLTVAAASAAEVRSGTRADAAITPAALGPMTKSLGASGYATIPGGDPANTVMIQWGQFTAASDATTAVTFATAFSEPAFSVTVSGTNDAGTDAQDNWPTLRRSTITATGFSAFSANQIADDCCFIAVGRIDLS